MRWPFVFAALVVPQAAPAQIVERVAAVADGTARFSYATRPEVAICDQGIRVGERRVWWRSGGRDDVSTKCRFGVAEVELEVRNGLVRDVDIVRDLDERTWGAVELGEVSPEMAARYLLSLAYDGATADGAEEAVLPAILANVDDVWRDLLDMAKDRRLPEGVRKKTLFWLGQETADAATHGLAEVALDEDEDQEIRDSAIFALSQRPPDEGIPVLMEVARSGEEAETRRTAMFWLAQSNDERVVDFFEEILLGRIR